MFIDIIMPFKNEEKYIEIAINSLLRHDIIGKIILIDDHSVDDSWKICAKIKHENPNQIILIKNSGFGKVSAINLGFKKVVNSFLWMVDADDKVEIPQNFSKTDLREDNILDINIFYIYDNKEKNVLMKKRKLDINLYNNYISELIIFPKASFIIPKKIYNSIFPIIEECPFEDIWISYNIWLKKFKVIHNDKIIYKYRQHEKNTFGKANQYSKDLVKFRYNRILKGLEVLFKNFSKIKNYRLLEYAQINTKFILGKIDLIKYCSFIIKNKINIKSFFRFFLLRYFPRLIQIYKTLR
jgi:glycosyltransferase involved in cell wall biosynthesis